MRKILDTTLEIKDKFPELYSLLKETPLAHTAANNEVDSDDFEQYLNTIQILLEEKVKNEEIHSLVNE